MYHTAILNAITLEGLSIFIKVHQYVRFIYLLRNSADHHVYRTLWSLHPRSEITTDIQIWYMVCLGSLMMLTMGHTILEADRPDLHLNMSL